jgi:hypothetical protein
VWRLRSPDLLRRVSVQYRFAHSASIPLAHSPG